MTDVKQKPLTLENLKEALVMYTGEQPTFDEVWSALREIACLGFVSQERQCGKVVWKYEKGKQYRA